ncbi:FG-GAP repeat domain-containing protein [Bradyrhizobium sp. RDT46]|uniref:FG-GAP repeat domain-containing protein n=1 Tax=Bradyrhizobium sp. RDT46 TaxID=3341829 RepID=UPI0035C73147
MTTNEGVEWFFTNGLATSWARVGTMGPGWDVAATADFNHDGRVDLLWQNETSGRLVEWFLNDDGLAFDWKDLGTADHNWKVAGLSDLHAVNGPMILMQNAATESPPESQVQRPAQQIHWPPHLPHRARFNRQARAPNPHLLMPPRARILYSRASHTASARVIFSCRKMTSSTLLTCMISCSCKSHACVEFPSDCGALRVAPLCSPSAQEFR